MEIIKELICNELGRYILSHVNNQNIDYAAICEQKTVDILEDIVTLLENASLNDFMVVDEIIELLHKNGISVKGRHDF